MDTADQLNNPPDRLLTTTGSSALLKAKKTLGCNICNDLDVFNLSIEVNDLHRGADGGCGSCCMLKDLVVHFMQQSSENNIFSLEILIDYAFYVSVIGKNKKTLFVIELYTKKGHPVAWRKIGPGRNVSVDSSSDACITQAKTWLSTCLKSHPACKRSDTSTLPSRVIDVQASDDQVRLYITKGEEAEYVALSHCWGGDLPLQTTVSTLKARQESIQFGESSKTFRDAVDVTKRLGIRYLWIDSVCIIQDSPDDWTAEAARMSAVYSNATVTISADRAARCSQGEMEELYARKRPEMPSNTNYTVHATGLPVESKLVSRGWVLQESLLSPRILHFNEEELSWICSSGSRCECRVRPGTAIPHMFRVPVEEGRPHSKQDLLREWPLIVMKFTRRQLTYPSDRLPAMSGLAGWVASQIRDTYLSGLWQSDLPFQLLWRAERSSEADQNKIARFKQPYAPSWSWASVSCPISYHDPHTTQFERLNPGYNSNGSIKPLLEVLESFAIPCTPNIYGPIKKAVLKVRARVEDIYARFQPGQEPDLLYPVKVFGHDASKIKVWLDVASDFVSEHGDKYVLMLAGEWSYSGGWCPISEEAVCLLLRPLGNQYVRVGFVRGAGSMKAWRTTVPERIIELI